MAGKAKPITFRLFWGRQPIERLTPEMVELQSQRLAECCERYCAQHPEALRSLEGKPYATITYYDAEGNKICPAT